MDGKIKTRALENHKRAAPMVQKPAKSAPPAWKDVEGEKSN